MLNNFMYFFLTSFIFILILFIIYYKYNKYWSKLKINRFNKAFLAKQKVVISPKEIFKNNNNIVFKGNTFNKGSGWSISFWIYINDWNYRYKNFKNIVVWKDNCYIGLTEKINNLIIEVPVYNISLDNKIEKINFGSIPLQKWINIVTILDGRNLDLHINGKLYKSKYLSNVPKQSTNSDLQICSDGGFDGYICRFMLYNYIIPKNNLLSKIFDNNILAIYNDGPYRSKYKLIRKIYNILDRINYSIKIDVDIDMNTKSDESNNIKNKNNNEYDYY